MTVNPLVVLLLVAAVLFVVVQQSAPAMAAASPSAPVNTEPPPSSSAPSRTALGQPCGYWVRASALKGYASLSRGDYFVCCEPPSGSQTGIAPASVLNPVGAATSILRQGVASLFGGGGCGNGTMGADGRLAAWVEPPS